MIQEIAMRIILIKKNLKITCSLPRYVKISIMNQNAVVSATSG